MTRKPWGDRAGVRYRTIAETRIVDTLLVAALPYEIEAGNGFDAAARVTDALHRWIAGGLGYAVSPDGERLFDPVEVVNHMKWVGLNGVDDFWLNNFVATNRRFAHEWNTAKTTDSGRPPPSITGPLRFSVMLRRSFDVGHFKAGQKLRLRLPLPLSSTSDNIDVLPIVSDALGARVSRSEGRLDFQMLAPSAPQVDIAAEISFTTTGRSTPADAASVDPNIDIYLRPSEGLVRVSSRIKDLSLALAGTENDPWIIVNAFRRYIIDEMVCGMIHYDQVNLEAPGDWALDSGWYDCQLGSALLISMCRAHGIPARMMSGHMLYRLAPGFHYWVEVLIEGRGWTPFDFLSWDLSEGGRDAEWRDYFAGSIDYRMVTQCMPLSFTGPMSIGFPAAWHLVNAPTPRGMEISFSGLDGQLIYRDQVTASRIDVLC